MGTTGAMREQSMRSFEVLCGYGRQKNISQYISFNLVVVNMVEEREDKSFFEC